MQVFKSKFHRRIILNAFIIMFYGRQRALTERHGKSDRCKRARDQLFKSPMWSRSSLRNGLIKGLVGKSAHKRCVEQDRFRKRLTKCRPDQSVFPQ